MQLTKKLWYITNRRLEYLGGNSHYTSAKHKRIWVKDFKDARIYTKEFAATQSLRRLKLHDADNTATIRHSTLHANI
jgi:hypothetical protein